MRRKQPRQSGRSGWSLISVIGAMTISAMVLGVCAPFNLASHRLVERNAGQVRARELARELTSRIREDVRAATTIAVTGAGSTLQITSASNRAGVRYQWSATGLLREVHAAAGISERMLYTAPLRAARFRRDGKAVVASFDFSAPRGIPGRPLRIETTATPRVEP